VEYHPDIPLLKEAKAEHAKLQYADTAPLRRLLFADGLRDQRYHNFVCLLDRRRESANLCLLI
jgi:hypothetical protein